MKLYDLGNMVFGAVVRSPHEVNVYPELKLKVKMSTIKQLS